MQTDKPFYDEASSIRLFKHFFVNGEGFLAELAPEGWKNSPLQKIHHPTPEQCYREALNIHNNMKDFFNRSDKSKDITPPKLTDFLDQDNVKDIKPVEEIVKIVGLCLWDIFSNNNEVTDKYGAVYDIGSFRGAAGFIGDYINKYIPVSNETYGYMDFYMGTIFVNGRADMSPVYEWVFKHLKRCDCDWIYHFPRMYVISPDEVCEGLKEDEDKTILEYDPSESFQKELEKQERKEETSKLRKELDDVYDKTVEEAKREPLPKEVQAYKNIYKKLPKGWPHQ